MTTDEADYAEPVPDSERKVTHAVCHHCGDAILKSAYGDWVHFLIVGEECK